MKAKIIKKNFLDMKGLIKSIQRAEGNPDCFKNGKADCKEPDCSWRKLCLDDNHDFAFDEDKTSNNKKKIPRKKDQI